jgi:class 3 adenylate cyclase/tetratricopeptide (TPR) repeat protein
MRCANCGTENESGRKFCLECGTQLAVTCPNCGTANSPAAKFCGECGTTLRAGNGAASAGVAATRPGATGGGPGLGTTLDDAVAERRLVTVLFADLVGFTPFAEERDAEDVRETLTRYFDIARGVVERYGGTVEKFIGDAVMAVWGTPTAHEDDAERAVRAALELTDAVRALGSGIDARAGVLTGEAAVTLGATGQGMVAGDLVNTAARLQSAAAPGTVLVGEATMRASDSAIVFEPAGEQTLKGKASPVPAWRALRVVAERGGRGRSETLEAPFVGRDDELRTLKDQLHATSRDKKVRLVSVTGVAGIGKSRLAWEFLKYIDGLVERVAWHAGRSPSYGSGLTFWALGEMVRGRVGLAESDDEATTRAKVAGAAAQWIPDVDERKWVEQALLVLLGIGDGSSAAGGSAGAPASASRDDLFAAWRTFFERIAADGTVAMVFEDLQWADSGTLDFLDHLVDWSRGSPILIVTLARPELLEQRSDWGAGMRNFVAIGLEPLAEPAMRELLAGLVPGLPAEAVRAIVARAEGIPLYAVETVRMLVADGKLVADEGAYRPVGDLSNLAVPDTLHALVAARLDALEREDRALMQDASVLGQSFAMAALAAVSGKTPDDLEPRLRALVRREILILDVDSRSPERGQYAFVQALLRDVAYSTLAKKDRKQRHLAAARYFESVGGDQLAGALASQYLDAYRNAAEGAEGDTLSAQARIALQAAAQRAVSLGSLTQAVTFFDQARELTADPADRAALLVEAGEVAVESGQTDLAEDRLRAAIDYYRANGASSQVAKATAVLGRALLAAFQRETAATLMQEASGELIDARTVPTDPGQVELLAQLARAFFLIDRNAEAIPVADRALEAAERMDLVPIVADVLITRGGALMGSGRPYEGVTEMRGGIELAETHGLAQIALRGRLNLGVNQIDTDPASARDIAAAGLVAARRLGRQVLVRTLVNNAAAAAQDLGDWDWALEQVDESLESITDPAGLNYVRAGRWTLDALRGVASEEVYGEIVEWARSRDDPAIVAGIHDLDANRAFGQGRFAEAADEWLAFAQSSLLNATATATQAAFAALLARDAKRAEAALVVIDKAGIRGRLPEVTRRFIRAGIDALDGRGDEALRVFREALALFSDMRLAWREAEAGVVMATVLGVEQPEVRAAADEARTILTRLRVPALLDHLDRIEAEAPAGPARRRTAGIPVAGELEVPSTA